jgi:hypothetical protein
LPFGAEVLTNDTGTQVGGNAMVKTLFGILLLAAACYAQQQIPHFNDQVGGPEPPHFDERYRPPEPVHPAILPDPKEKRERSVLGKALQSEEFLWHTGHALAMAADIATTRKVLDTCASCNESNPLFFAKRPSLGRQLTVSVPLDGGLGYVIHWAFKHNHKWWGRGLSAEYVGLHTFSAAENARHIR